MPTITTSNNSTTYTINNLINDQIYRVRVAASNSAGVGPYTEYIQVAPSLFAVDPYYYDVGLLMHMDPSVDINLIDPYAYDTSLLLHMDGSNGSTTFTDSSLNTKTVSRVNSANISTADQKFGSASCYFDGSSYLSVSNKDGDFSFGTGDFTVECWIKMDTLDRYNWILGTPDCGNMMILINKDNNCIGIGRHCYEWAHWVSHGMSAGNWYHVAISRSGTSLYMFVNGQMLNGGSPMSNGYSYNASGSIQIGSHANSTSNVFQGYIDEYRVTKGVARYTSNFTPSTTAFSINPAFIDSSSYNRKLLSRNSMLSSSESKFGGYSGYFNGSSYVRSPGGKAWQLGTDDFTIESWIKPSSLVGDRTIAGTYDGGNGGWRLAVKNPEGGTPNYGPEVSFTATNYGSEVDVIIPGQLEITRNNQQGIYNSAVESYYSRYQSPTNTVWNGGGWSNVCNYTSRPYYDWLSALYNSGRNPGNIVGLEMIMKHTPSNRYWLIKFSNWQSGGGGGAFAYTRQEILSCTTTSSIIQFRNGDSSIIERSTSAPIPTGDWSHIAAVRSSGVLKLFLDGNQVGADASFTSNITRNNAYGLSVGSVILSDGSTSSYFNGYLDDLRITKKVARYTETFIPPIGPFQNFGPSPVPPSAPSNMAVNERNGTFNVYWDNPVSDGRSPITSYDIRYSSDNGSSWTASNAATDPYYSNVVLLLPMNGSNNSFDIYDESKYNRNILLYGDTKISTDQNKFGGSSANFNISSNSSIGVPGSNDFNFGANDFTFDCWVYLLGYNSSNGTRLLQTRNGDVHSGLNIGISSNGQLTVYASNDGSNWNIMSWSAGNIPLNTWTHIAVSRYEDNIYTFIDGSLINTTNTLSSLYFNVNDTIVIGGQSSGPNRSLNGYINDLRITQNVARYKTNFNSSLLTQAPANRVSGLTSGTSYVFKARAQNSVGYGPYSSTNSTPISTLGAVTNLTVIPDDSQAYLSWTAPSANNSAINDYSIQYSSDGGSSWTTFSHTASTNTSIIVIGLNNSSNYVFRVAAVNFAGIGTYSSVSSSVTVAQRLDTTYNKTRLLLHLDSNT